MGARCRTVSPEKAEQAWGAASILVSCFSTEPHYRWLESRKGRPVFVPCFPACYSQ